MIYNRIIAVTGLGGLFELLNSKNEGAIVRSLEDKSTRFVSSRVHSFSHLESIEVYTTTDNVNLVDVFHAMEKSSTALPDTKADGAALKSYFGDVYPDMDFERVYTSDMKKMIRWFQLLKNNEVEIKLLSDSGEAEAQADEGAAEMEAAPVAEAEAPAPKAKKAAKPKKEAAADADASAEEKPKKTARKKKTEE
jgi:hypothetical protein